MGANLQELRIVLVLNLNFSDRIHSKGRILCLGAHADDIEIGCGGTVLRWLEEHPSLEFCWVVLSSSRDRKKEALKGADLFLQGARKKTVLVEKFRDGFFPFSGTEVKEYFEDLKKRFSPDIVLTRLSRRPPPGPSPGLRPHLEHLPRGINSRIRNSQV